MDYLKIEYDSSRRKGILSCEPMLFELIRENFSMYDESAKSRRRFTRNNNIPLRKYAITPNGRFDPGLLHEIVAWRKSHGFDVKVDASPEFKQVFDTRFSFTVEPEELVELNLVPRPHQREGIVLALKYGSGIFLHPTASGKTLTMATTIVNILKKNPDAKILLITLTHLVKQFVSDFISYGLDPDMISSWTGDNPLQHTPIVVAGSVNISRNLVDGPDRIKKMKKLVKTAQKEMQDPDISTAAFKKVSKIFKEANEELCKLVSSLDKNVLALQYFPLVDVLMIDEVHQCKKENLISYINTFVQTKHKFGYTGTLPTEKIDEWNIIGRIGPVRQVVSRQSLEKANIITTAEIKVLNITYKKLPEYVFDEAFSGAADLTKNFRIEQDFLYNSEFRNGIITKISKNVKQNILIVVDRIAHGEHLLNIITEACPDKQVFFIEGVVNDDVREDIKTSMEESDNVVCIAIARIFSTGVNVKNIHYILFANEWKARISIIQTVGRGVRKMKDKDTVVVFDLFDQVMYGIRHFKERKTIYDNEKFKQTEVKFIEK